MKMPVNLGIIKKFLFVLQMTVQFILDIFLVGVKSWKRDTFANVGRWGRGKHTIR